jgi:hypothetical protein
MRILGWLWRAALLVARLVTRLVRPPARAGSDEARSTVLFALDGVGYEVEVTEAQARRLRGLLVPYIAAARPAGTRPAGTRPAGTRPANGRVPGRTAGR